MKKWSVDFDANIEPQNVQKVWSILPSFPMMFWQQEILEVVGEKIGKFIALEEGWEQKVEKRSIRILIEVDLRDSLCKEIQMEMHGSLW